MGLGLPRIGKGTGFIRPPGWDPTDISAIYLKIPDQKLSPYRPGDNDRLWWENSLIRAELTKAL